jgi:hypothetical protein
MKQVNPERFKKPRPESIAFEGEAIPDSPPEERPNERTSVRTEPEQAHANLYTVVIPERRRKVRHAFDIYEDQLEALKKLQIAAQDEMGSRQAPTLGEMAQKALDAYISAQANKTPTVRLLKERNR